MPKNLGPIEKSNQRNQLKTLKSHSNYFGRGFPPGKIIPALCRSLLEALIAS